MSIIIRWRVPEGRAAALVAAMLALIACGPAPESAPSEPAPAASAAPARERVISLSPAASRFLIALGASDRIIAVDSGSSRIPELRALPVVDLASAGEMDADLILWPGGPANQEARVEAMRAAGREVVRFEPHSIGDAYAFYRDLGARLVGTARARSSENALAHQLAAIGGASFGRLRPRVAGVIGSDPPELAGGHSFLTDLIEIAGARSVTHEGAEVRLPVESERLKAFAPDLLLVSTPGELTGDQRRALEQKLPGGYRVEFLVFDPDRVWTQEVVETARRLRALIEPLTRELEAAAGAAPPARLPPGRGEGG
jgi:ABC-type Fe3+-hydroxamate transport system substrate-binding protein